MLEDTGKNLKENSEIMSELIMFLLTSKCYNLSILIQSQSEILGPPPSLALPPQIQILPEQHNPGFLIFLLPIHVHGKA